MIVYVLYLERFGSQDDANPKKPSGITEIFDFLDPKKPEVFGAPKM